MVLTVEQSGGQRECFVIGEKYLALERQKMAPFIKEAPNVEEASFYVYFL